MAACTKDSIQMESFLLGKAGANSEFVDRFRWVDLKVDRNAGGGVCEK